MPDTTDEYYTWKDVFENARSFFSFLLRKWIRLVLFVLVCWALAVSYYFIQKPKYEAVCTFVLEEKQGGLGGLGGIASQFGIDLGGMSGSSLFAGDNILDILRSNLILQKALLSKIDSSKGENGQTLADIYMQFAGLTKSKKLREVNFNSYKALQNNKLSLIQDSVLQVIQSDITKKKLAVDRLSRKGSIISVSVTSPDQYFSKLLAERIVNEARNMYVFIKSGTAYSNVRRLEQKADSILRLLNAKTYQAASNFQVDANPALRTLNVPSEISGRDKTVLGAVYLEVVKNLEVSKTILTQETPVIEIIDEPRFPLRDKAKGLFFLLFVSGFVGLIVFVIFSWLGFASNSNDNRHKKIAV